MIVKFNGVDLTSRITVLNEYSPFVGADYEPIVSDDLTFFYLDRKSKIINLPFITDGNPRLVHDWLQEILNVKEPKKLEFGDNRYFDAVPTGKIEMKRGNHKATGSISFLVVDGVSKSKTITPFTFTKQSDGSWKTKIVNNGSEWAYVNYNIDIARETGYIGLVSEHGILQFGKVDEADTEQAKKNVKLHTGFTQWTAGTTFYENQNKKDVTDMSIQNGWLKLANKGFTNTANGGYFGAIQELTLSEACTDWYIWARARFEAGLMGQTGEWALCVVDENNQLIAGMIIEKYDRSGNKGQVCFTIGGQGIKKTIPFTTSVWLRDNPYGGEGITKNSNMFDLKKEADKVTFYWYGSYFSYQSNALKNLKAKKVQFFLGQMAGLNSTDRLVTEMGLSEFSFTKLNATYWKDVPNRYPSGTKLKIDGQQGKLYVNNKVAEKDEIKGSKYFLVPPGETEIILTTSSFGEIKSATAEIVERWV
ncbi:phage tail family protein [Enterococcus cecorum]|uniref:distal tail protein Dit n=1 Tax=Enterococcus cecorum TaxID=44008 RepID=UPI002ACA4131|nr:distal tail protein Dit [Enterococcus cecorum]MDZ5583110.1 phage tail family protein [Enterococcus cecorum]